MHGLENRMSLAHSKKDTIGALAAEQLPPPLKLSMGDDTELEMCIEMDDEYQPYLSMATYHKQHVLQHNIVYLNNAAMQGIANMFTQAAAIEYPCTYFHCAEPIAGEPELAL
jgi:hypothetical protein